MKVPELAIQEVALAAATVPQTSGVGILARNIRGYKPPPRNPDLQEPRGEAQPTVMRCMPCRWVA